MAPVANSQSEKATSQKRVQTLRSCREEAIGRSFASVRGAALPDRENLLEGTGKGVRHVKLRAVDDVKRPGVKKWIAEAAKLNKKDPQSGMMVGMRKRKRR